MEEKLAIQLYNNLLTEFRFYMNTGNMTKAAEIFGKMGELGNKCPQLARLINSAELGTVMTEAGFTAAETEAAVGLIEGATMVETAEAGIVGGAAPESMGAGMLLGRAMMTIGVVIAIAVILGTCYLIYKKYKKGREDREFSEFARRCFREQEIKSRMKGLYPPGNI